METNKPLNPSSRPGTVRGGWENPPTRSIGHLSAFTLLLFFLLWCGSSFAQSAYQVIDSKMTIHGTSSLHDWVSEVTEVKAQGDLLLEQNGQLRQIRSLRVSIPVTGIVSQKGRTMDRNTHRALRAEEHPVISFQLSSVNTLRKDGDAYRITANGNLTIAGATRSINLDVVAVATGAGAFRFEGSKQIKMSDFGVDPPTAMLGTLKTGDDVTIKFSMTLAAAPPKS